MRLLVTNESSSIFFLFLLQKLLFIANLHVICFVMFRIFYSWETRIYGFVLKYLYSHFDYTYALAVIEINLKGTQLKGKSFRCKICLTFDMQINENDITRFMATVSLHLISYLILKTRKVNTSFCQCIK